MKALTEAHQVLVERARELEGAAPPSLFEVVTLKSETPASAGFERWLCLSLARRISHVQKALGGAPPVRASETRKGGGRW